MTWWMWLLAAYLLISAGVFIRLSYTFKQIMNLFAERKVTLRFRTFASSIVLDALAWPWYIVWYGLQEYISELRDPRP